MKIPSVVLLPLFLLLVFSSPLPGRTLSEKDSAVIHVTYYHGTIRCHSCLTIEQFSAMTMQTVFAKRIAAGSIVWRVEDYEMEEDTAAVRKYDLQNQALIISKRVNGVETGWRLLPKVWDYTEDYTRFRRYLVGSIKEFDQ
jgi:hypothetical protein